MTDLGKWVLGKSGLTPCSVGDCLRFKSASASSISMAYALGCDLQNPIVVKSVICIIRPILSQNMGSWYVLVRFRPPPPLRSPPTTYYISFALFLPPVRLQQTWALHHQRFTRWRCPCSSHSALALVQGAAFKTFLRGLQNAMYETKIGHTFGVTTGRLVLEIEWRQCSLTAMRVASYVSGSSRVSFRLTLLCGVASFWQLEEAGPAWAKL